MDTTQLGTLAEIQAQFAYLKDGWEVFVQSNGKAPFDLVAYKQGVLRRVTVKGTTQRAVWGDRSSYVAELRSIRPNRTGNKIKQLSNYDELFVYVLPWEKGFFFTPTEVNGRTAIAFSPNKDYREIPWKLTGMDEDTALKAAGGL